MFFSDGVTVVLYKVMQTYNTVDTVDETQVGGAVAVVAR